MTDAQRQLAADNLSLAWFVLARIMRRKEQARRVHYPELRSAAQFGLVKAAIIFDQSRDKDFVALADRCIRNEIVSAIIAELRGKWTKPGQLGDEAVIAGKTESPIDGASRLQRNVRLRLALNDGTTMIQRVAVRRVCLGGEFQRDVAKDWGVSRARIGQHIAEACAILRENPAVQSEYLGLKIGA